MLSTATRTASLPAEASVTNKLALQRLKFKARAPNGKIYTYGKRSRLDNDHRNRAINVVKQTPNFLTANAQEQQEMMDAAVQECDEKRKKRGLHTSSLFHGYGIPIIEERPEDLLVTPQKVAPPVLPSREKAFKSLERVSVDDRLDESDIDDDDDGEDDEKREEDANDDEGEEDKYLTGPFTPKRSAQKEWADIMDSISSKRPRRSTIGANPSTNSLHSTNTFDIPDPSSCSPAAFVRRYREVRPKPPSWDDEDNYSNPGPLSAPMSVPYSYSLPTVSSSNELTPSLYRGMPLIVIDDDDEDDEAAPCLHMEENPGLSSEWKKTSDI